MVFLSCSLVSLLYGQQYNFRTYSLEEGLPQSRTGLNSGPNGNFWVGPNEGGLCRFNGKEFQVFTKKQGLPDNLIGALHQDHSDENLISNAIKFSPPQRKIQIGFQKNNGQIITAIKDQGPGLTQEDMQLLFQKYQKLSARPTGGEQSTGLGLSIVKKYVEAMKGCVWCESKSGEGAIFKVQFDLED